MELLRLIICDDEPKQTEILENYILEYNHEHSVKGVFIEKFNSGESLLQTLHKKVDVALLDIEMLGVDGLEVAEEIRAKNKNATIVFITGHRSHALKAYSFRALDYIVKPITRPRMMSLLSEIMTDYDYKSHYDAYAEATNYFSFQRFRKVVRIPHLEILAFERSERKIKLYTRRGVYEFYSTLKEVMDDLSDDDFLKCHQSYIVNKNHIKVYNCPDIIMESIGLTIPVNRNSRHLVKQIIKML